MWIPVMKNLIVKIFERRWLITFFALLSLLVFGYWYWHTYFVIASLLLDMDPKLAKLPLTEFEKKITYVMEQKIIDSIDYICTDFLDPLFGEFLTNRSSEFIVVCSGLCLLYTIFEILLFLEKEIEIRVYYSLRRKWLRKCQCIISGISDGVYKIELSSNSTHQLQLGDNNFAQYMANLIIEDFVRIHELNMPTKKRKRTIRRLTNACENVLWMKTRDLRKRIKMFGQFKGTLDIGHDVQIDLAQFYNGIPLNITIKNCLVNSTLLKIIATILKILFLPAVLFTDLMKLIGNAAKWMFLRLTVSTTTQETSQFQREVANPMIEDQNDQIEPETEQPPDEMPQDYQSLAHPLVNDLTDDSIRNSNLDNEQLNQNNHIEQETIEQTNPALARFRSQTLEVQLEALMKKFEKTNRENQKFKEEVQQLKFEVERLFDERTCVICMDKEIIYLFMPCKHLVSCEKCGQNPSVKECPICRKTIQKRLKTYMS